jgi:hypothetical protein
VAWIKTNCHVLFLCKMALLTFVLPSLITILYYQQAMLL